MREYECGLCGLCKQSNNKKEYCCNCCQKMELVRDNSNESVSLLDFPLQTPRFLTFSNKYLRG